MYRLLACSLLLSLLVGCGDEPTDSLSDLARLSVVISAEDLPNGDASLTVWLTRNGQIDTWPGRCLELGPSFSVRLGEHFAEVRRGETQDELCLGPKATGIVVAAADRAAPGALVVSDASRTIEVELADRLQPRPTVRIAPADGVVRPGTEVALTWSPAGTWNDVVGVPMSIRTDRDEVAFFGQARGSTVVGMAPQSLPEGPGLLCVDWAAADWLSLDCPGARCVVWADTRACAPVTLVRRPR